VARAFAREGARVFLAGRTRERMEAVAETIRGDGGTADTAVVDALDQDAVDRHADAVVAATGRIDVVFNGVGADNGEQGMPHARTHFVTARAAARHMSARGSGVILALSNPTAGSPAALTGPFGQACAAVENLSRHLAAELGRYGVRVICLRPAGMPETAARLGSHTREVWSRAAGRLGMTLEEMLPQVAAGSPLERALTVAELANVAAFLASDRPAA
jgi:3-oxoacyl-[acyl-carrier protein] reductase